MRFMRIYATMYALNAGCRILVLSFSLDDSGSDGATAASDDDDDLSLSSNVKII